MTVQTQTGICLRAKPTRHTVVPLALAWRKRERLSRLPPLKKICSSAESYVNSQRTDRTHFVAKSTCKFVLRVCRTGSASTALERHGKFGRWNKRKGKYGACLVRHTSDVLLYSPRQTQKDTPLGGARGTQNSSSGNRGDVGNARIGEFEAKR